MKLSSAVQNKQALFPSDPAAPRLLSFTRMDSYHDEAPSLNPSPQDLTQHLQGVQAAPASQDRPPTTVGTLSHHFLEKLADSPPARRATQQKLYRQLLSRTSGAPDPASLGKKEAQACYEYFKAAQQSFDELARTGAEPQRQEHEEQRDLCRMLKWQFRASRDQRSKTVLDQALAKSRATVAEGGSLGNQTRLGVGMGVPGMASIVPGMELSTGLSTTQGRIIRDTTSVSAGVTAKLSARVASAQAGVSVEKSTVRKYGDIDAYANARSRSKWTWWNGSKRDMLTQSRNLFASCNHYKRNIRLAAQSQLYLEKKLRENGLASPGFERHSPKAQPFQIERGTRVALTGSAEFDGLGVVTLGATVKADILHTTKNQAMDIIGLHDSYPELARTRLDRTHRDNTTAQQLISAIDEHVDNSSEQLTSAVLRNLDSRKRKELTEAVDSRSRELANQYIHLKISNDIAEDSKEDRAISQRFTEHALLLRPDSLKIHTAKADTETRSISTEAKLKVAAGASAQTSVKLSLSSVKDDDPHLSGTYLDLTLNGQFNSLESLQNLVSSGLSRLGVNGFDPAPIVAMIAGTVVYQQHGVSATFSLKIKEGKPVLLLSQKLLTQTDNVNRTIDTPTPLTVEVGLGGLLHSLLGEQLGSQSLDLLLPLALGKLSKRTQADIDWWDGYVHKHANAFDKLLNNIANGSEKTLIVQELEEIRRRISPAGSHVVDSLFEAAKAARDNLDEHHLQLAREALKEVFFAYIDDYYDAKVKGAWRVE
ncbi:hypothetical protein ACMGT0_26545 [Pseudomonas sp. RHF3.3-3]|uniref:hypothetical protein n=1 Tax=Pseudomonas sp. RHF3.3-3 TaxID=3396624 RepID=UPI003A8BEDCE